MHNRRAFLFGRPAGGSSLAAQAELFDQRLVARLVLLLQIVEEAATQGHHLQKAATGMVILHVALEVLGEIGDALGEDRHLDLRRAGIGRAGGIFLDQRLLAFGSNRHRGSLRLR